MRAGASAGAARSWPLGQVGDCRAGNHVLAMRIGIIGAGMAGLTCGTRLASAGHEVTIFDKGRGPGGRMAVRRLEHQGATFTFDHGAQYFTARDPAFVEQVAAWSRDGIVARWPAAGADAWVGTPGMNAPIRAMADALGVHFATRIDALERDGIYWRLKGQGASREPFDAVVVAVPAEQAAPLLEPYSHVMGDAAHWVASKPCWAVMVAFEERVDCADVLSDSLPEGGPLGWAARNSNKPERDPSRECWVLHASPEWTRKHLECAGDDVCDDLLDAFAAQVGALPGVVVKTAHRWRYAKVAKNDDGALWDRDLRLGACGDWLSGPRVENAFLSGMKLAASIAS